MAKHHKYTDEELKAAVVASFSLADTLRRLGYDKIAGGNSCNLRDKLIRKNIDFSHFTGQGHRKGKRDPKRKSADEILVLEQRDTRPKPTQLKTSAVRDWT